MQLGSRSVKLAGWPPSSCLLVHPPPSRSGDGQGGTTRPLATTRRRDDVRQGRWQDLLGRAQRTTTRRAGQHLMETFRRDNHHGNHGAGFPSYWRRSLASFCLCQAKRCRLWSTGCQFDLLQPRRRRASNSRDARPIRGRIFLDFRNSHALLVGWHGSKRRFSKMCCCFRQLDHIRAMVA